MTLSVALAMLEREGRWLLQLRDDIEGIVFPGTWGLFGGHLDPGESPEQALRRELLEEIRWKAADLHFWFEHRDSHRIAHFFRASLTVPLGELALLEGQDMALAAPEELAGGTLWSPRLRQRRGFAPSLRRAILELELGGWPPGGPSDPAAPGAPAGADPGRG